MRKELETVGRVVLSTRRPDKQSCIIEIWKLEHSVVDTKRFEKLVRAFARKSEYVYRLVDLSRPLSSETFTRSLGL